MRKYLLPRMASVLLLVLLVGALLPHTALANSQPASIQVTGTAVVTATPDIAYITLGVETQDLSADKAAQENANLMAQVLAALGTGTDRKNLAPAATHLRFHSGDQPRHRQRRNSYHVLGTNRINITRDLTASRSWTER